MREVELLLIDKKEWTADIHHNVEDSQKHHAEQKNPGSHRGQFSFFKILGKVKLKRVTIGFYLLPRVKGY